MQQSSSKDVLHDTLSLDYKVASSACPTSTIVSDQCTAFVKEGHFRPDSYRPIGSGSCGSVYHRTGSGVALKRAIPDAPLSEDCKLSNDYDKHQRVISAFSSFQSKCEAGEFSFKSVHPVTIPSCQRYIAKSDETWWADHSKRFPCEEQYREDVLHVEHIPPLSNTIRNALIDQYCDEPLQETARTQISNHDCLVRLYLGKRRNRTKRVKLSKTCFGLRNFPLCVNQMQQLGLDTRSFALAMADALAVMHWHAHIDAADVEFVLGSAPRLDLIRIIETKETRMEHGKVSDEDQPNVRLWLLDFNQCQDIAMNETGVEQAVKRFFDNDAYFPRPCTGNQEAEEDWLVFSHRYLKVSTELRRRDLQNRGWHEREAAMLPTLFVAKVKEKILERENKKRAAAIRSGDSWSDFEKPAIDKGQPSAD